MIICSDDYIVIDKYAAGEYPWIDEVDTDLKRENLIKFSLEVAAVFIAIGSHAKSEGGSKK